MGSDEEDLKSKNEKDQSLVDLGQALDDRGRQRSAERELEIDARQAELDQERQRTGNGDSAQTQAFELEQSKLDRAREREREVLENLDRARSERDAQREALKDLLTDPEQEPGRD